MANGDIYLPSSHFADQTEPVHMTMHKCTTTLARNCRSCFSATCELGPYCLHQLRKAFLWGLTYMQAALGQVQRPAQVLLRLRVAARPQRHATPLVRQQRVLGAQPAGSGKRQGLSHNLELELLTNMPRLRHAASRYVNAAGSRA
jgi:hypothetical protein